MANVQSIDTHSLGGKRIGLALSGGGFRATVFHLGVILALRDAKVLEHITHIAGVSGGAILAAHLVNYWRAFVSSQNDFIEPSKQLLDFTRRDLAGMIVRRLPISRAQLLTNYLSRGLYWDRTSKTDVQLKSLSTDGRPELYILATNLTTGMPCCYTSHGGGRWLRDVSRLVSENSENGSFSASDYSLARAVTASAAYPAVFPEIRVTKDDFGTTAALFGWPEYRLSDGGVFDNSALTVFRSLGNSGKPLDLILSSDATRAFDLSAAGKERALGFFTRPKVLVRSYEISSTRLEGLAQDIPERGTRSEYLRLRAILDETEAFGLSESVQQLLHNVRTDFDAFSKQEQSALVLHGYAVARAKLKSLGLWAPAVPAPDFLRSLEIIPGAKISKDALKKSHRSRIAGRIFSPRDWISYAHVILIALLLAFMGFQFWRWHFPYSFAVFPPIFDLTLADEITGGKKRTAADNQWLKDTLQQLTVQATGGRELPDHEKLHAFSAESRYFDEYTIDVEVCPQPALKHPLHIRAFLARADEGRTMYIPLDIGARYSLRLPRGREEDYLIVLAAVVIDAGVNVSLIKKSIQHWDLCK